MLDIAHLHRLVSNGSTLLVPNLRAARSLRKRLHALPAESNTTADVGARVIHWRGWTQALWQASLMNGTEQRMLLQPLQERVLWEAVLDADSQALRTDTLLDLCLGASARVFAYGAQEAVMAHAGSSLRDDTVRFARWFRQVQQRCAEQEMLPGAALEHALARHVARHAEFGEVSNLVVCHLDALTPAQEGLLRAISFAGVNVTTAPENVLPTRSPARLLACADADQELQVLADHLRVALAGETRPNVAVIVPDLSTARDSIDRAMRERFSPASVEGFHENRHPLWEFSTGRPLAAQQIVSEALLLLAWTYRDLRTEELSSLLRSPYLSWPMDAESTAELDAALLRRGNRLRPTWSPRGVAHQVFRSGEVLSTALQERTSSWHQFQNHVSSHSSHAENARRLLRDFGWPGPRTLTSEEFQAMERFHTALDELAALDCISGEVEWTAFLRRLEAGTRTTLFARENTDAPVQFLTPEESAGSEADQVWVAHADEAHWNSSISSNPLLAWHVQQQHGMPGLDPTRDQARFRELVQRIAASAPQVTFSYAETGEDGDQRLCPSVEQLAHAFRQDASPSNVLESVEAMAGLEPFEDGDLVPLLLTTDVATGGVSILKSQASCAFRAFAERRLGSSALEERDLGLDARDRGDVLHKALQIFWQTYQTQESLLRLMRDGLLTKAVHHAVKEALHPAGGAGDAWGSTYLQIQRTRLESLLTRWLESEAKRPAFRVEQNALERDQAVTIGGLPLRVRVDRVDIVKDTDGREHRVIIDYKTGDVNHKQWEGDRPEEPQLPLYAAVASAGIKMDTPGVGAIAFGIVRAGDKLGFQSMPKNSTLLQTEKKAGSETIEGKLEEWRYTLEALAGDFAAGIATVGPKQYPATCRFCEQRLLCRLNPELLEMEEDEAEAEA